MEGVSFIVTVYNKAGFLPGVAAALARQEGDFAREFIFVDDGSTDGSGTLLDEIVRTLPNAVVVRQANQGPSAATNTGLARARGRWVKLVDGDDLLPPWATRLLLDACVRTGSELAYGDYVFDTDPDAALAALGRAAPESPPVETMARPLRAVLQLARFGPSAVLVDRARLDAAGGCDVRVFTQDYLFALRLAHRCAFAHLLTPVVVSPLAAPGRMTDNKAQILHDINAAIALFLAETPDLAAADRRYALRRAAGRAWHWARRERAMGPASRYFWINLAARLGLPVPAARLARASCAAFLAGGGTVRQPAI
jgi:glycosyltransferase involved in cell wall biosynthesis